MFNDVIGLIEAKSDTNAGIHTRPPQGKRSNELVFSLYAGRCGAKGIEKALALEQEGDKKIRICLIDELADTFRDLY